MYVFLVDIAKYTDYLPRKMLVQMSAMEHKGNLDDILCHSGCLATKIRQRFETKNVPHELLRKHPSRSSGDVILLYRYLVSSYSHE